MRTFYIIVSFLLCSMYSYGEETIAEKIARAQSAAPDSISKNATIMDMDGKVLKKGTNGWTCLPGTLPGDKKPMCNDAVWGKMMKAVASKSDFSTDRIGISYMLQGDAMVSNSNPYATDQKNGDVWVQEGPHLMIIVPKEMLKGITDDPFNGGPYVMWKDTPYAHIMVPVTVEK
ncbi:hypothetical protein PGH07_05675 [Sulfurovum sp. zt1-1]|uniref:Uncharacterized protein n=1 Tax=Sulfurovum zhangzhouensis TaxID=3019067 RepID=A0ABT7QZJ9_9BACT|nr:hypothetical protein [Sulfurovum zhangzhouensis]MDM5271656.1 hypothetical protein [Sulfurovum zhangzhouensis]